MQKTTPDKRLFIKFLFPLVQWNDRRNNDEAMENKCEEFAVLVGCVGGDSASAAVHSASPSSAIKSTASASSLNISVVHKIDMILIIEV